MYAGLPKLLWSQRKEIIVSSSWNQNMKLNIIAALKFIAILKISSAQIHLYFSKCIGGKYRSSMMVSRKLIYDQNN